MDFQINFAHYIQNNLVHTTGEDAIVSKCVYKFYLHEHLGINIGWDLFLTKISVSYPCCMPVSQEHGLFFPHHSMAPRAEMRRQLPRNEFPIVGER